MWPRWLHRLSPLEDVTRDPKGIKTLWDYDLEVDFQELNKIVSVDALILS